MTEEEDEGTRQIRQLVYKYAQLFPKESTLEFLRESWGNALEIPAEIDGVLLDPVSLSPLSHPEQLHLYCVCMYVCESTCACMWVHKDKDLGVAFEEVLGC